MSKSTKYTKEKLEPIVKESFSIAEVIKKLGIKWSGGQQQNIKRWINVYELDTSHFLGQKANQGEKHKGGLSKKHWSEILIKTSSCNRRVASVMLRRALIESGRDYKCENCNNTGSWCDKDLRLQINHKDMNWSNNDKENLQFLCPNCHSQTSGWSGSKGETSLTSRSKQSKVYREKKNLKKDHEQLHT